MSSREQSREMRTSSQRAPPVIMSFAFTSATFIILNWFKFYKNVFGKDENMMRSPLTMLCQVAERKLNVTSDWCSFIISILYYPRKCTILYQKRSTTFYPCECKIALSGYNQNLFISLISLWCWKKFQWLCEKCSGVGKLIAMTRLET